VLLLSAHKSPKRTNTHRPNPILFIQELVHSRILLDHGHSLVSLRDSGARIIRLAFPRRLDYQPLFREVPEPERAAEIEPSFLTAGGFWARSRVLLIRLFLSRRRTARSLGIFNKDILVEARIKTQCYRHDVLYSLGSHVHTRGLLWRKDADEPT